MKKAIISGIVATVIGGGILLGIERLLSSDSQVPSTQQEAAYLPTSLDLIGSNNLLRITSGGASTALSYMSMVGSNVTREVSLPKGQQLKINIVGSNNEIKINESVFPQVTVTENGSNNSISKNQ